ncbi:Serine acetyltransferase [Roseovarius litorisediminis]|uniref:Serine acetyltransferase n=1 Tax=Roseovarius litorisediminis TaxID=1312363 RepID=A0A1Y5SGB2_9RHOB|nr:serine O-acetyltransferase [Roseovarius litorisediminis]SLN38956.1 Serine acetyltransferase [Roseovarius litorisediminis]
MISKQTPETKLLQFWQVLRQEARVMAQTEPFLAPKLSRMLLRHGSLQEALATRLANDLTCSDMSEDAFRTLLLEMLNEDPAIVASSVRDLVAVHSNDPACRTYVHAFLNYKGFHAVQVHRIAHQLWETGRTELAAWLSNRVSLILGPDIHPAAQLGTGIMLDHGSGVVIGETAVVEDDVTILQNVTLGGTGKTRGDRHPKVRRGVMIGAGANIIGNVEIGAFSKVGAGSVVLKDVPQGCTVAGMPARIVRLHRHADFRLEEPARPIHG